LASEPAMFPHKDLADTDVFDIAMKHFGITMS
jgi:hypothetical protein